jgi:hypothetical protein
LLPFILGNSIGFLIESLVKLLIIDEYSPGSGDEEIIFFAIKVNLGFDVFFIFFVFSIN